MINPRIGQKSKHESKSDKVNAKHQGCQDIQVQRVKDDTMVNTSTSTSSSQANVNPNDESVNSTKYDLDLCHKVKRTYKNFLPTCQTLQHWEANTKFKFGFIPLGELNLPAEVTVSQSSLDALQLHKVIKKSDENDFMHSQIMVDSQLKPDAWDKYLVGYWDKQLPLLICFGFEFPLDFNREAQLVSHSENHSSPKAYTNDIDAYLQEEIAHKAILGPYTQPSLPHLLL